MTKYIVVFLSIGTGVILYSLFLEPFTNIDIFNQKYMELSVGQNNEFYALRESMLTPKYYMQDIGITMLLISIILFIFLKIGDGYIKSPKNKFLFISLAIVLPFISVAGFIFDLFQGMYRNEFPRWADSLGIPLAGVPILLIILSIWSMLHLVFLKNVKVSAIVFKISILKKVNIWLIFISSVSFLLLVLSLISGLYWYAIPGLFWMYYYLSLGMARVGI